MKFLRYIYRGLFGPKCPQCDMRDFEWTEDKLKIRRTARDAAWELKCNACGAEYWKFKGSDNRLFEADPKKELSYKIGETLTTYERKKMTDTFDGRIVCPDCEHYPLCGSPNASGSQNISCTKCGSEFIYHYKAPAVTMRLTQRMPNETVIQIRAPEPEPDNGFLLEGSL